MNDFVIAEAIRYAGDVIAKAILVAFLEPDEQSEAQQQNEEQAEIERIRKLQRGE